MEFYSSKVTKCPDIVEDISDTDLVELRGEAIRQRDVADVECSLCFNVFYEPITLPCGHTFDRQCLLRAMYHKSDCPLCRKPFHILAQGHPVSYTINNIVQKYFSREYKMRQQEIELEKEKYMAQLPILPLKLVIFPNEPLTLHVVEPKYRLLISRCLEGSCKFGVISLCVSENKVDDVGTLMRITDIKKSSDGSYYVFSKGESRFTVTKLSTQDGYFCAGVKWLDEEPLSSEDSQAIRTLASKLLEHAKAMLATKDEEYKKALEHKYGKIPSVENPYALSLWLSSVLPFTIVQKQQLLHITRTRERLEKITDLWKSVAGNPQHGSCTIL